MQATVRLARYATETTPQLEAGMQRVASLVKLCQSLNYETMITAVRMKDPAKFADTIAANLPLSIAEKQRLLEIFDPAERLSRNHFQTSSNSILSQTGPKQFSTMGAGTCLFAAQMRPEGR